MKNPNRIFKNKRGVEQEVYFVIIESVLVLVVIIAMLQWVSSIAKDEDFEKLILSRDIALTMNTLQNIPGDIYYNYSATNIELQKFNYKFKDNLISILDPGKPLKISYPFSRNLLISSNIPITIEKKDSIEFEINNNILTIK
ncbi:hypothetical protein CMO93_03290 [Candidatus Woesearchaeota archaeon]|nr:hypothetical protein [Candidatus Woesearchaeota archaeon]|tara:strand:+ start:6823 stop:7248 length:426 start_codon:yes stop_codon:yes gene_type:complete